MDRRLYTCCFSGHRNIRGADIPDVMNRTEEYIRTLIDKGVTFFAVGGALGYDTLAAELLFRLRSTELPQIKVCLLYPFDGFTNCWNEADRTRYARMLPQYDKVVRVSNKASREAYLLRDRVLVGHSAYCICYCARNTGGTAYTVRYALKQGIKVLNVAER